ncbi:MAG: DNA alkylation repair protein [Acidobacteria bacterium]|nr:DNA alkylation repair protein [Acidobacteriota bacterium]
MAAPRSPAPWHRRPRTNGQPGPSGFVVDATHARTAAAVRRALRKSASRARAKASALFFKAGKGGYGEGDVFIGVTVPHQRRVARRFRDLPLEEAEHLLTSRTHEERLTGLLILVDRFNRSTDANDRRAIFDLYVRRLKHVNNWDLVDTSAGSIVGGWLSGKPKTLLDALASSDNVWARRVAMLATFHDIKRGDHQAAIRMARRLVDDPHDMIRKAVGWMLREVGKRASPDALDGFLAAHAATMPRTTLRYAIERLPAGRRRHWLGRRDSLRTSGGHRGRSRGR